MQVADKEYQNHQVFTELDLYTEFYEKLSMSVFPFPTMGTNAIVNIDTYVYSSMQGTLESIKTILLAGRINDSYALLRKFYDSIMINIYSNVYLKDNFSIESFVVEKINKWLTGKEPLPEYRIISQYIRQSARLSPINDLLYSDEKYKSLRERCNDHTHYNLFEHLMLNDNEVYIKNRANWLEQFRQDVQGIFTLHLGYLFFLNPHYMQSDDYISSLDFGLAPEEGAQYWVAPFVQNIFNQIMHPVCPDIVLSLIHI